MYDPKNLESILEYAKELIEKSLRQKCSFDEEYYLYKGKGSFGQLLERFYFRYLPNSESAPDFPDVGMELKSSPIRQLKNEESRIKERLVLSIINYHSIVEEDFERSSFLKKNAFLLIVFYLWEPETDVIDLVVKLVDTWKLDGTDLTIIKRDWELIRDKVRAGMAHELSEGDTLYLGACTKGANSNSIRSQPNSPFKAKQRAFSLKQGYMNHVLATLSHEKGYGSMGRLISDPSVLKEMTLEEIVLERFQSFLGKRTKDIADITGVKTKPTAKNYYATITAGILNVRDLEAIDEFRKANILVKTIRIEMDDDRVRESLSFPAFEFERLYHQDWDRSELKDDIERRYLFIFFKAQGEGYVLDKVRFWTMPYQDRQEVRRVWLATKRVIVRGEIFKGYQTDKQGRIRKSRKGHPIRLNNFPKMADSPVCHVRPHGRDSSDTYPLPVADKMIGLKEYSKQSFWLLNNYVKDEIYRKNPVKTN